MGRCDSWRHKKRDAGVAAGISLHEQEQRAQSWKEADAERLAKLERDLEERRRKRDEEEAKRREELEHLNLQILRRDEQEATKGIEEMDEAKAEALLETANMHNEDDGEGEEDASVTDHQRMMAERKRKRQAELAELRGLFSSSTVASPPAKEAERPANWTGSRLEQKSGESVLAADLITA